MCNRFKNFVSCHVHEQSLDTAATPEDFAEREIELGTGYLVTTDHGTMQATRKVYDLAKAKGLRPILGCLMPGQEIHTLGGVKNVEDIVVGDLVLTHKGRFCPVTKVMSRDYNGPVYTIYRGVNGDRGITVTEEHPILIADERKQVQWVQAKDVVGGKNDRPSGGLRYGYKSYVLLPRLRGTVKSIRCSEERKLETRGQVLPLSLPLTPDLAYFLGLHCAEGWTDRDQDGSAGLTFNINEREFQKFCVDFLKTTFDINVSVYDRPERGSTDLVYCHKQWSAVLARLCGVGAHNKRVPSEILCSRSRAVRKAFLRGLLDGDGKKGASNTLKVSSKALAWGARLLAIDFGSYTTPIERNDQGRRSWSLELQLKAKWRRSFWVNPKGKGGGGRWRAYPVRDVVLGHYSGKVYNFTVFGDNSYVSDCILHNCEGYVRDDNCPILLSAGIQKDEKGTLSEYAKYFHATLHARDQAAYEAMIRILSRTDLHRSEKHGSERKPLFTWADLEELGAYNITATSSCLAGMVQRHLVDQQNVDGAIAYYEKFRSIVGPQNWYVEIYPHVCDSYWQSACFVTWADGTKERFPTWRQFKTSVGDGKLEDLSKKLKDKVFPADKLPVVNAMMLNRKWTDCPPKPFLKIELLEGFFKNECTPWAPDGDLQLACNKFLIELADYYGDPVLVADDSHFTKREQKIVQDVRLMSGGNKWRFAGSYHRQDSAEAFAYFNAKLGVDEKTFEGWVENTYNWAKRFDGFELKSRKSLPTSFYPEDTLGHTIDLIEKVGRMDWDDSRYVERLKEEISRLHDNGTIDLLPYFFLAAEAIDVYAQRGEPTGPGRGSAAGVLLTYLLGITHVDPLKYKLSLDRFLTLTRIKAGKLPDVDLDFPHRDWLVDPQNGWLQKRFGDCYAQISVDTTLKLRSSVKDVARVEYGYVPPDIEALAKNLPESPQGVSDYDFVFGYKAGESWVEGQLDKDPTLMEYVKKYPKQWEKVQGCLGLSRQKSRHACAYIIANEPVSNFIPLTKISDVTVTSFTAPSVEAAGGLKMDFLVINSLNDIKHAIQLIQARHGGYIQEPMILNQKKVPGHRIVPIPGGGFADIWDLPEDQDVFNDFCTGHTETVFQFNTNSAVGWLEHFNHVKGYDSDGKARMALDSIEALGAFTALARPGPLDYHVETVDGDRHNMLVEYAIRARGGRATGALPILDQLLPETYGVIVYQEQLEAVFREVGNTTADQAEEFRRDIAKKAMKKVAKHKEVWMPGAIASLGKETAEELWASMETFGQYGFNKSHAISYVIISYACAYLKHHYPLEWWTAVLRNADKNEINETFWRYCGHLIDHPDVNRSGDRFEIINERIRAPLSLMLGIGDKAHRQLCEGRPYANIDDFCAKNEAFKRSGATKVLDDQGKPVMVQNKKTGELIVKMRAGHSALNKSVVGTLIVSGAMDSLFPEGLTTTEQLQLYFEAAARAAGKKRPKNDIPAKFLNIDALSKFQMRKSVLPAYTEELLPLIANLQEPRLFFNDNERGCWRSQRGVVPFVSATELERLDSMRPWPEDMDGGLRVACAAFVMAERQFNYGGGKQACEYIFDVSGGRVKSVRWPPRGEKKLDSNDTLTGAVVVVLLSKWKEDKPFSVEDLIVVQPALDNSKDKEESPE